jgi:AcrR family transcriptional regulator
MKEGRIDRRIKYTKMVLRESLLGLMKTKPISKITSTELCRSADINRNTFYAHYSSPEDLLSSIEEELYAEIKEAIEHSLKFESIPTLIVEICQSIQKNVALCQILFSEYGDALFLRRIMYIAHDKSIIEWKKALAVEDPTQMERLYTYFANGCVAIIQAWVQEGAKESPQKIAYFIDKVSNRGLRGFL